MPTGNLPAEGAKLHKEVYDKALNGSCKGDKECAARVAWTAVKNAGWYKDKDGNWHKSANLAEFSLRIERASLDKASGEMRWRAVASDIDEDSYGDSMSLSLFNDFLHRIETEELVPEEFRSEFWSGGIPYLSVSHYLDLNGKAVPGPIDVVFIDGHCLKAKGRFNDTPLGRACFKSVCKDLYDEKSKTRSDKVRISIAFLDWAHKHKSNGYVFERKSMDDTCPECFKEFLERLQGNESPKGKEFLKGHLIHLALTRVPVNTRTSMEVERSMTTRKEDAASIIGEELADEIDEESKLIGKSEALVIKADEKESTDNPDEECVEGDEECVDEMKQKAELEQKATKKEADCSHPSSHYLVVEDASEPSKWHLRVKDCSGKPDHRLMGAAWAALHSDHRGNKYEGPNKEEAIKKLTAMYKREGLDTPSKSDIEKMDMTSMPIEYRPFEGATSMKDALDILNSRKEEKRVNDLYYMFSSIIQNILSDDTVEDKPSAIENVTQEFKNMIEDTSIKLYSMVEELYNASKNKEISTRSDVAESVHVLDAPISQFKAEFDQILASEISNDEKLQAIQEPFNAFGKAIIDAVKVTATENHSEQAQQNDMVKAFSEALKPLIDANVATSQKLDLVLTQLNQRSVQPAITEQRPVVPERRSIQVQPYIPFQQMPATKSETPKLRALIERTT